ncbi:unnamed protein product [Notodromas monacha]|uniref:Uncharacterized protein n=1 Tax=Notodromas monacha TaxID=399045 RepID=A0A7R9BUH8_9CRUS|nr:unnamed protein product [Notodromas monacha]CAG0921999.1 unnamed protein product [Notodromas monacha]
MSALLSRARDTEAALAFVLSCAELVEAFSVKGYVHAGFLDTEDEDVPARFTNLLNVGLELLHRISKRVVYWRIVFMLRAGFLQEEFSTSMLDASSLRPMNASERSIRDDRSVCEESVKTDVDRFEIDSTSSVFGGHGAHAIRRIDRKAMEAMCNCDDSSVKLKAAVIFYAADEELHESLLYIWFSDIIDGFLGFLALNSEGDPQQGVAPGHDAAVGRKESVGIYSMCKSRDDFRNLAVKANLDSKLSVHSYQNEWS